MGARILGLRPEIPRFPEDLETPNRRHSPAPPHASRSPGPPLSSARSPSLRDDANQWGGRALGRVGIDRERAREGVGGGGGEGAERPFKAIAIRALSPVLGC